MTHTLHSRRGEYVHRESPRSGPLGPAALIASTLALWASSAPAADAPPLRIARQPDLHGDLIAFVHAEDIWTVPASGGVARRITFHEGEERHPTFSADGQRIAFTGEYDGNADVYVMSPDGGDIARVTWHPGADEVIGWHPTNGKILFRSGREAFSRFTRLYLIAPDGSGLEAVPLHEAGWGSFSADGARIAYTRVAIEDRTWKRYRGGLAPDIWLHDLATGEDRRLTDGRGSERFPLWIGDAIWYQSDEGGRIDFWTLEPAAGRASRVTRLEDFDAGRPEIGGGRIVFERGGRVEVLDPATGECRPVPIEIRSDADEARPYLRRTNDQVTQVGISPDGARALVVARGEVFSVPREKGLTRNLSRDPGSRDREAVWSPDGKRIAFLSDRSGEVEVWLADPLGSADPLCLTTHASGYRHGLRWSPDSRKIAFSDETLTLFTVDVETRQVSRIDKAEHEAMDLGIDAKPICDHVWSPDGRLLAYSKMDADLVTRVYVHVLETGATRPVTGGTVDSFAPAFSDDGRRLFFISNRRFDPTYSDMDFELVYKKVAGVYALALTKGLPSLSPPELGDVPPAPQPKPADAAEAGKVEVDFDGIEGRVEPIPLPRGNYRRLAAAKGSLYWLDADSGDFNRFDIREPGPRKLVAWDLGARKLRTVLDSVDDYRLSADGARIVWRRGNDVGIVDAAAENASAAGLDLSGLAMRLDPRAEWKQIFREVWRLERDFFYDPAMHGLDWSAVGRKYEPLVEAASSRTELRWVIGELIGELATSHTYVYGGDRRRRAERVGIGLLGADWEADAASGRWRVRRILRTPDWTDGAIPPLAAAGVDAREGDFLLTVDGRPVTAAREVHAAFEGVVGRPVQIGLCETADGGSRREAVVVPVGDESRFRYLDWVERNRRIVDEASGGKIGYLHLPDTFTGAANMFPLYWYGQTRKEGLVIDGRFNGGGLDPDPFLDRIEKPILFWWTRRNSRDYATPLVATRAHLALVTNRQAGSGGDMLPAEFQLRKLGPVVGTRTWGGLVGISMFVSLIDGGGITAPDYRVYSTDGKWVIENEGVEPDIPVDLDPAEVARGHDAQLMAAVEHLKRKIAEEPRPAPVRPEIPRIPATGR